MAVNEAAMAVVGILAQAHIGDHRQFRHLVLDRAGGPLDNAVFGVGLGAQGVFFRRDTEKNNCRDAQGEGLSGYLDQVVNG